MKECPFCNPELDREQEIVLSNAECLFFAKTQPRVNRFRGNCPPKTPGNVI